MPSCPNDESALAEDDVERLRKPTVVKLYVRASALSYSKVFLLLCYPTPLSIMVVELRSLKLYQAFNNLSGNLGQVLRGGVGDVSRAWKAFAVLVALSSLLTPLTLLLTLVST
uniref:Uncharacterized protein n=1 Tax=Ignisphaera aggregans TaxID=334771 RepID=A0A7C4FC78_9CREN